MGDSEYGCASFLKATSKTNADLLLRLRSNRCFYGSPPPYSGKGRPRVHGDKFNLNDSTTWWEPQQTLETDDLELGPLKISRWDSLHFYACPERQ